MCALVALGVCLGIGSVAVFDHNVALSVGMAFLAVLMGIIAIVGSQACKGGYASDYHPEYERVRSRLYVRGQHR